jgi:RNA polymerase sigma-70 factor (ECF subfamily)
MDDELVRRAMRGDAAAFDVLGRARIDRLYGVAYRILRDPHAADDAVQQALWAAWRDLRGLRDVQRFDAWLYRLLVNACYRLGRRERRLGSIVRLVPELDATADTDIAGSIATRDELEHAFRQLTPEHRAVVVMHHYIGLPLTEIAEVLDIPAGTARSRLHHAHRRLRATLEAPATIPAAASGEGRR